jgi:hypothetical protein
VYRQTSLHNTAPRWLDSVDQTAARIAAAGGGEGFVLLASCTSDSTVESQGSNAVVERVVWTGGSAIVALLPVLSGTFL